ncbi:hypothetical protein VNO77_22840 [Canavalia gladiata]|uniref:Uncharacterized protein n=1 Tax=Canavalia gladiata TaxID=3824 RepID=A0AAN9L6N2_CANGL
MTRQQRLVDSNLATRDMPISWYMQGSGPWLGSTLVRVLRASRWLGEGMRYKPNAPPFGPNHQLVTKLLDSNLGLEVILDLTKDETDLLQVFFLDLLDSALTRSICSSFFKGPVVVLAKIEATFQAPRESPEEAK